MRFVAKTDVGKKRSNNEDSFFAEVYSDEVSLFMVADGLGGYNGGEVASHILVDRIASYIGKNITRLATASKEKVSNILNVALSITNEEIYRLEKTDEKYKGMGTTLALILKVKDMFYYMSIGDSRIYYLTEGAEDIEQITIDDTYVNELIKTNVITEEEAINHPQKHVLTKAIGILKRINANVYPCPKKNGYFLLCSDGLTNMVETEEIKHIFKTNDFDQVAENLVLAANQHGGIDNITAIVVKI